MIRIDTPRLLLRPFVVDDETTFVELLTDPIFMEWSLHGARTEKDAKRVLKEDISHQEAHGFSKYAMIEKKNGRIVGYCGLGFLDIEDEPMPELGFRLIEDARGKGYATEASRGVINDSFERLNLTFLAAIVEPGNVTSANVLSKLEFVHQRQVFAYRRNWELYKLNR